MSIEVELRSFVDDAQYAALRQLFDAQGTLVKEDTQETTYFTGDVDFRIQRGDKAAKLTFKSGKVHDPMREEIEIAIDKAQFDNYLRLTKALGYDIGIIWYRHRLEYHWQGLVVTLDDTRGYGKIIEFEKEATPETQEAALAELKAKMAQLGVELTPAEEFSRKFADYKANWRVLTGQTAA